MDKLKAMEHSSKDEYEKFLDFCSISLKGENPKFLDLIKTRYADCDDRFRCSGEMVKLLEKTQKNMAMEESRKFVHLKEFLTKLKINTAAKWKKNKKKRKHSSDSDPETSHQAKAPKLKDCSVVVTKFPDDDIALFGYDGGVDVSDESNGTELFTQKACSISDGDVNGASNIVVADDDQVNLLKEELGSAMDFSNNSPMSQVSQLPSSRKVDIICKETKGQRNSISDSCSSISHIPFTTRGISSRKPIVYLDIDDVEDFAEGDPIEIGPAHYNEIDSRLASAIFPAPESENWQTKNKNADVQTPPDESTLSGISITNEQSSEAPLTSFVDVKLSDPVDVLVISPSSSCQTLVGISEIKTINQTTEQQEKRHHLSLTVCSQRGIFHNIDSDAVSGEAVSLTSACVDKENTSNISLGIALDKAPVHEPIENPSLTTSVASPKSVYFENKEIIEIDDELKDTSEPSLSCEESGNGNQKGFQTLDSSRSEVKENQKGVQNLDTLTSKAKENQKGVQNVDTMTSEMKENQKGVQNFDTVTSEVKENQKGVDSRDSLTTEVVHENLRDVQGLDTLAHEVKENQKAVQNQDTSMFEAKSSVVKLIKRLPLLSVTKDNPSGSSLPGTKAFSSSFSKQDKAAEKPSSSSETKVVPSLVEARPPESADSADEFQKADTDRILDKSQLKQRRRVAKLEHLLESLRDEIEKCHDAEMTLDDLDDDNATYIYEDKLKRKFVAVWNKLCEVTGRTITTGRPTEKRVRYSGTRYQEINRRIEKFLNKKKVFPDFHDIKSIVKLTNKKCNLNLSPVMMDGISRDAFVDIGEMLQTRRHQDFIATFGTRQTDVLRGSTDPYLTDPDFRRKVDTNRQVAKCNLDNVIAKYTKLQKERLYGEDGEEAEEESDEDEENMDKMAEKITSEEDEKDKESGTVVEDVTTESIEVEMAEKSDNEDTAGQSKSGTSDTPQKPLIKYNPSIPSLGRSAYLLSPDKGKAPSSGLVGAGAIRSADQQLDPSSSADGPELVAFGGKVDGSGSNAAGSIIVIDESPAKSQQELQKSSLEVKLNPFSLDRQDSSIQSVDDDQGKQPERDVADTDRRGPNIKFTARKPLHPEIDSFEKPRFDGNREDLEKSKLSCSVFEIFDDDEDDDQSSDSTSDQDVDDKGVDDDVDEIVMIINRSESECDTVSTRDPSPISVVSLSSESLEDMTDNWEKEDSPEADCTTTLPVEVVSSPKAADKHFLNDDSFEKRQFLEAMGIRKSENEAPVSGSLAEEVMHEKNKNAPLGQTVEEEEVTASQNHSSTDVEIKLTDGQQKKPVAESPLQAMHMSPMKRTLGGSPLQSSHGSPVKRTIGQSHLQARHASPVIRISQDSDDCIIISDTPKAENQVAGIKKTNHLATVAENLKSVKKILDFKSGENCSTAPNDGTKRRSTTELPQLNAQAKQVSEINKKIISCGGVSSCELFDRTSAETDFSQAAAKQGGSGIAEKLHSLNSFLQRISGSTADGCTLPDISTDANNHGPLLEGVSDDRTGTAEVNVPESGDGVGTRKSPCMQDSNICMIDSDVSNDSFQTGIHIMDVCSVGSEPRGTHDEPSHMSVRNTGEYSKKTTSSLSDAVRSQAAVRNKTTAISGDGGISYSCTQGSSTLPQSSLTLSHPSLSLSVGIKSSNDKYNSTDSVLTTEKASGSFQTSVTSNVTDGDSQDSCIEIIDEFEDTADDSSSTSEPNLTFKQKSGSSFCKSQNKAAESSARYTSTKDTKVPSSVCKSQNKAADSSARYTSTKDTKVPRVGSSETKQNPPSSVNCHSSNSKSEQIKLNPEDKKMILREPSDAVFIDLCESSSVPVICLEHTLKEALSVTEQEINLNVDSVQEKQVVEHKSSNCSLSAEISVVESPEQDKCKNTSIETPKGEIENTSIETSKDKIKKTSIETAKDKSGISSIEKPKQIEYKNTVKYSCENVFEEWLKNPEQTGLEDAAATSAVVSSPYCDDSVHRKTPCGSNDSGCVNLDQALESSGHGHSSEGGNSLVKQDQDSANGESDGNPQENMNTERMGSVGDNVHIGSDGNNEGNNTGNEMENVHINYMENIEDNADTVGSNENSVCGNWDNEGRFRTNSEVRNDGDVQSRGPDRGNVQSGGPDRVNVQSGGPDRGNVQSRGPDRVDVSGKGVENEATSPRTGSETEKVQIGDGENVLSNSLENDDDDVRSISDDAENVSSFIRNKKVVHARNERGGLRADSLKINEENSFTETVGENGNNFLSDDGDINQKNIPIGNLGDTGIIIQANYVGSNEKNVLINSAGINEDNAQADNDGNNEDNVCVSSDGDDSSRDMDKINDSSQLMDSTVGDNTSKLCENIPETDSSLLCDRNYNVGESKDLIVETVQSEDHCADEEIVQVDENEQKRMNQEDVAKRSCDSNNKVDQRLEVKSANFDDENEADQRLEDGNCDDESVDLLSTDSPNWDVELEQAENEVSHKTSDETIKQTVSEDSQKAPGKTVKQTGHMELTCLDVDGGVESISEDKYLGRERNTEISLGVDNVNELTEQEDSGPNNREGNTEEDVNASGKILEQKDLNVNSRDRQTEEEALNENSGIEYILVQEDLNENSRDGKTEGKCLNADSRHEDLDEDVRTSKQLDVDTGFEDDHISAQTDLDTVSGYTEQKDSTKENEDEHEEVNNDVEDSISDTQEGSSIVLDYQSVRSLDVAVIPEEEDSRVSSENIAVTEITGDITESACNVTECASKSTEIASNITEKISKITESTGKVTESTSNITENVPESSLSEKIEDSSNIRRHDEKVEKTGKRCVGDEEEDTVADEVNSGLAGLQECRGSETSIHSDEMSESVTESVVEDDSRKCVESRVIDDEDEVKIVEELSSVKGVRHSDKSKEDDRRMVDQLLIDIGLSIAKESKLSVQSTDTLQSSAGTVIALPVQSSVDTVLAVPVQSEADATLPDEPGKSSNVCEVAEQSSQKPSDALEKASLERDITPLPTNSMCHASVFSVECEEVDESELSPPASVAQDSESFEIQPKVTSRKRPFNDTSTELQSDKDDRKISEEKYSVASSSSTSSDPVIDVDVLQFKKPKVVDYDLINDVISSVLAEFPTGGSTSKFPSSTAKQSRLVSSKTTTIPEVIIGDDDDDDEDVVIMEESSSEAKPPVFPVALHKNQGSPAFRQQSSVAAFRQQSSLGRGVRSSVNQPSFRKHPAGQLYGNPNHTPQNVPSASFQAHPQMSSSNGRRFSFATKTRSPAFMRTKNSFPPTGIPAQNRPLPGERAPASQSLPRLSPRVPIPSIQPDRAGNLARTPPKCLPGPSASFVNKRFQSPTSGQMRSPVIGHIRSPAAGNIRSPAAGNMRSPTPGHFRPHNFGHNRSPVVGSIHSAALDHSGNTFRPHMPAASLSRKRTYMSSMSPSPSNSSPTGVALRGGFSGRPTFYPRQPPFGAMQSTVRHPSQNSLPPQRLQPQQFHPGPKLNTVRGRSKQQGAASRVEIVVGDSDDEGEYSNASSGPRIVSVSSLSTSTNSDTSFHNPSRVPGGSTEVQPRRPNGDVIVIPD